MFVYSVNQVSIRPLLKELYYNENVRQSEKLLFVKLVKIFRAEFTDLEFVGGEIICNVRHKILLFANEGDFRRHIRNKGTDVHSNTEFTLVITTKFLTCNLPYSIKNNDGG